MEQSAPYLLIEPVWNRIIEPVWNRNATDKSYVWQEYALLIEPVWNRNMPQVAPPAVPPTFNRTSLESKRGYVWGDVPCTQAF